MFENHDESNQQSSPHEAGPDREHPQLDELFAEHQRLTSEISSLNAAQMELLDRSRDSDDVIDRLMELAHHEREIIDAVAAVEERIASQLKD